MAAKNIRGKYAFPLTFALLILLHIILINATRLFPFTDLPNHLAGATIHRYYGEAGNRFAEFFTVHLFPKPNVFHLVFCALPFFPTVEFANRIYLSLYAAGLPLSFLYLIRRFGGDRWFSLLAFPFLYNYSASWGFVGFLFALPLLLLSFALMTDLFDRGGTGRMLLLALLLTSLFFVHALAALFALLLFIVTVAARSRGNILGVLKRLPPALPLLLLFAAWSAEEPGWRESLSAVGAYYAGDFIGTLPNRIHLFFIDNYHLFEGARGIAAATVFSLLVLAAFLAAILTQARRGGGARMGSPLILLLCALGCFLLLPAEIPGQTILHQRFAALVLLSLALLGAVAAGARGTGGRTMAIPTVRAAVFTAAALLHFLLWAEYFTSFDRENGRFGPCLFPSEGKWTLAGLIVDHTYRGRPSYIHFPSYYTVWRRGIATTSLVDYRFSNVRRRPGTEPLPAYSEWLGAGAAYNGRYEGADLLLVRGDPRGATALALEGRALVRKAGEWRLYGVAGGD